MARQQLFFRVLFVFVAYTLLPTVVLGNKKTAIFNKIADTTRDLQAISTGGASALPGGGRRFSFEGFFETFEELADKQWGAPKATLDIDLIELLRDVYVNDDDHTRLLQEAWADPEILRTLMDDLPLFDVIKPLRALKEKKEMLTPSDGIEAALALKDTMGKLMTSLQSVRDPERFAEKMYEYSISEDPTWKSLLARIEAGDTSSHLETQQFLLNKEIGDLIDLEAMGFGGQFPEILGKAIKSVKEDEPLLWDSLITDPVAKRVVEDPMTVVKEVINAAMDAAGYAKSNA